jgi:hypothetical protein
MFATRTKFLRGEMPMLDYSDQKNLLVQIVQIISLSAFQEPTHRPQCKHSLFGVDRRSWTFRPCLLRDPTIILIGHGLSATCIIPFLDLVDKSMRDSRDNRVVENWAAVLLKAKVLFCALLYSAGSRNAQGLTGKFIL